MSMMNRRATAGNPYQGSRKRVLCVCSAGLLRSPTAAFVLSQPPWGFNTRAVGSTAEYALIPLEGVHVHWADEIVVMNGEQAAAVNKHNPDGKKPVHRLDVPDQYQFREDALIEVLTGKFMEIWKPE